MGRLAKDLGGLRGFLATLRAQIFISFWCTSFYRERNITVAYSGSERSGKSDHGIGVFRCSQARTLVVYVILLLGVVNSLLRHSSAGFTCSDTSFSPLLRISDRQIVDTPYPRLSRTVSAYELGQRAFVHELGNSLAGKIVETDYRNLDPAKAAQGTDPAISMNYFGDPKGIISEGGKGPDFDTGANLERCVFGNVVP